LLDEDDEEEEEAEEEIGRVAIQARTYGCDCLLVMIFKAIRRLERNKSKLGLLCFLCVVLHFVVKCQSTTLPPK
jgi:hypothetical protein